MRKAAGLVGKAVSYRFIDGNDIGAVTEVTRSPEVVVVRSMTKRSMLPGHEHEPREVVCHVSAILAEIPSLTPATW